jgi:membrane protein implicated in regulation of membrane protease activity
MRGLDIFAVALGLVLLTAGTISLAIAGAWAQMVTMLPIGLSLVLVPRRGGEEGAPAKSR